MVRVIVMAQEMVEFTKSQILQQAGTSTLARADHAPRSVLSLLRRSAVPRFSRTAS